MFSDTIAAAVQWTSEHGVQAAAAKFGMSDRSVHRWVKAQGVQVAPTPVAEDAATAGKASATKGAAKPRPAAAAAATPKTRARGRNGRRYGVAEKGAVLAEATAVGVTAASVKTGVSRP